MLIPNPDLNFWNSNVKIHFWANLGRKSKSRLFCLKLCKHGILEELIPNLDLEFQNSNAKIYFFGKFEQKKSKLSVLSKIGTYGILEKLIPNPKLDFRNFKPKINFWANFGRKSILCLFSFETLLLFLDIQLVLVLYFKIALNSSAAILQAVLKVWSVKCLYFYYFIVNIYIVGCVLIPILSKSLFTYFYIILLHFDNFGVSGLGIHLVRTSNIWSFSSFLGEEQI